MKLTNASHYPQMWLMRAGLWLSNFDRQHLWVKYALVLLFFGTTTLFMGEYTWSDYRALRERKSMVRKEINRLTPLLQADSVNLEELKALGPEVEVIAREKYLMKSPGEEIFLIKSTPTHDNDKE